MRRIKEEAWDELYWYVISRAVSKEHTIPVSLAMLDKIIAEARQRVELQELGDKAIIIAKSIENEIKTIIIDSN